MTHLASADDAGGPGTLQTKVEGVSVMGRTIGHYAPWFLVAVVGGLIAMTLLPNALAFVGWPVLMVLLALAIFSGLSILVHGRHLCERCVASMPLDASTAAKRYSVRFRVAHLFERRLFAVGYLAAVLGSALLQFHSVGRFAWAVAEASLIYLLFVYVTHQRLQPWCPYCRHGGQERTTPITPRPVPTRL